MRDLRVTLVQSDLRWEDPEANCAHFSRRLDGLQGSTDLVVLPEMFTTGFSMRSAELAENMDGPTLAWMRKQAVGLDAALYGSVIIEEHGTYFNRGLFVKPEGEVTVYDKRHLFRFANETDHFSPGKDRVVAEWRGWRILLQICFDLRFPVFSRNRNDYDLALYVANWPEARRSPWSRLLPARAIENQCYVAGLNRVGTDGKGITYTGDSVLVDPKGEVAAWVTPGEEGLTTHTLDRQALEDFREKFPVAREADDFELLA